MTADPYDPSGALTKWLDAQAAGVELRPGRTAAMPLCDCHWCGADLRAVSSTVGTPVAPSANTMKGRFWRRHKCPVCARAFYSGVPVGSTGQTDDVVTMPKWFPRAVLREHYNALAAARELMIEYEDELEVMEDRILRQQRGIPEDDTTITDQSPDQSTD